MGIRSEEIDQFAKRLRLDPRIAFKFRNSRFRSVELIIQGLDLLTRTTERYGAGGRKIFCINRHPISEAIRLIDYLSLENAEEVAGPCLYMVILSELCYSGAHRQDSALTLMKARVIQELSIGLP